MSNVILQWIDAAASSNLFLKILNISISASWLVLAVLVLRLLLKKAPKWVRVLLWAVVAIRLILPVSIESVFSLIPNTQTIPMDIALDPTPTVDTGINAVNSVVNPVISGSFTPNPAASANPLQILIPVGTIFWIVGIAGMLLYTAVSYLCLRWKLRTAVRFRENIFQSEHVGSPFVLGICKPRIYLPFQLEAKALLHVLAHEQAHIRRKDHLWKPLGFLLLTVHWFNPLMWLAYILLCRDIELACDEKVIKELGSEQRADYTQALVTCSIRRPSIAACPLAFGEVGVKTRVKSVMNYKKPGFWVILLAVVLCLVVAVCFLTDPVTVPTLDESKASTIRAIQSAEVLAQSDDFIGSVSAGKDMEQITTSNGDILLITEENTGVWYFEKGQEVQVSIRFKNDGSYISSKKVGYVYCGEGTEGLFAQEIFSNQTVPETSGVFTVPKSGNYLFYFGNYSSSWLELERFHADVMEESTEKVHQGTLLPSTETAFELKFAGNTSLQHQVVLTQDKPYCCISVKNEGTESIVVDIAGTVYRVESETSATICTDEKWEPGTYTVGFATSGSSGMFGNAVCKAHSTPQHANGAVLMHDLRSGDIEVSVDELQNYVFLTNWTQIAVTVKSDKDFEGTVILKNYTDGDVESMYADVSNKEKKCVFQNLTSAIWYGVKCEGLDGCTLVISQHNSIADLFI